MSPLRAARAGLRRLFRKDVVGQELDTRIIAHLLFDVGATDPITFTAVASVLGVVPTAACYVPARRAACVDPVRALRQE